MVMDPSDIQWELKNNPGTLYTATSRGKTLGSRGGEWGQHPRDSAIHWINKSISANRIRDCAKKNNGQFGKVVLQREEWVKHLRRRADVTAETYNEEMADEILRTTYKTATEGNLIPNREALKRSIGDMIKFPNDSWSKRKTEWELPTTYFDA